MSLNASENIRFGRSIKSSKMNMNALEIKTFHRRKTIATGSTIYASYIHTCTCVMNIEKRT